jgi:ABC-type uncharacterized transport system auxiliary subunit
MNMRCRSTIAALLPFAVAACLSSRPPAPPVRFFDPLPAVPSASARPPLAPGRALRVVAAPHLGREWAVRVGAREFAFDAAHQWTAEPAQLVAQALQRAGFGEVTNVRAAGDVLVELEMFEVDLTAAPMAHVRLSVRRSASNERFEGSAKAESAAPDALAAAMAAAIADLLAKLH